jgi:hypothetical protein
MSILKDFIDFDIYKDSDLLSFGLLLPQDQTEALINFNQQISQKQQLAYHLDNQNSPPYVRIYEAIFPKINVDKVINKAKEIIKDSIATKIKWAESESIYDLIILWIATNQQLRLLQEAIIYTINDYREGYYKQKYLHENLDLNQEEKQSVQKWGWPYFEMYEPYVVVAKPRKNLTLIL